MKISRILWSCFQPQMAAEARITRSLTAWCIAASGVRPPEASSRFTSGISVNGSSARLVLHVA